MSDPFRTQAVKCLDCRSLRDDLRQATDAVAHHERAVEKLQNRLNYRGIRARTLAIGIGWIGGWIGGMSAGVGLLIAMLSTSVIAPVAIPLGIGLVLSGATATIGGAFAIGEHFFGDGQ